MRLVVVESPAKCGKIQGYLGPGYKVVATMGHIRALEESLDAVGLDTGWTPKYRELPTKKEAIGRLRAAAAGADEVIVATDDDREGEGIGYHVCALLSLNPATTKRIVFHEITERAITDAIRAPKRLDMHKVAAQQARAMLDLLVGFTMSRVLWTKVAPKLSAGRCQTPALRLVVERDAVIEAHKASSSYRLSMSVGLPTSSPPPFKATATEDVKDEAAALAVLGVLRGRPEVLVLAAVETVSVSAPPKPLITSTLQQEASSIHGLSPKTTMMAAQKLYEAGHITYMRTDQAVLSSEAVATIREWVSETHGAPYLGAGDEIKKTVGKPTKAAVPGKPEAQAAHEAIRPTHPERPDVGLEDGIQKTVYALVWRRAVQSQMAPALTDVRKATLACTAEPERKYIAEQTKSQFLGWRVLEKATPDSPEFLSWKPHLIAGARLAWTSVSADEHFTKPKPRYTEASLIKELEDKGIGRPSTFASLVETIQDRDYVEKTSVEGHSQDSQHLVLQAEPTQGVLSSPSSSAWPPVRKTESHTVGAEKNKVRATALGRSVAEYLGRDYGDLFAYSFTADMEGKLDAVAKGAAEWKSVLQTTWDTYKERYQAIASLATGSSGGAVSQRQRVLSMGPPALKVIQSKKGPLYVREGPTKDAKATFAALGPGQTYETATAEQAEAAFAVKTEQHRGELLGEVDGHEVWKKRGPYGLYVEWNGVKLTVKSEMTLEDIGELLRAKAAAPAYARVIGDFTIKRGPYGLYFYKHANKKATFLGFPATLNADAVTATDMTTLYSATLAAKKGGRKKKDA
jgi:DNA topoisomerase-1